VSVQIFNLPSDAGFRVVLGKFAMACAMTRERFEIFSLVWASKIMQLDYPDSLQFNRYQNPMSGSSSEPRA
jgi:hypothetical protein